MKNVTSNSQTKVFVAMSGGVDSSVTAALLKEQGYDITGVFMKNWSGDNFGIQTDCPWEQDQKDVEAVCKLLEIPFRSFNFEKEYREKVIGYFFEELAQGRTPNPDVMCNKEIKFALFLDKALALGADLIATGHYARVSFNADRQEYELRKGLDPNKDQSYFLHQLTQKQLSKTLFPIGELKKPEVRKLAHKYQLPVADKPDSQGICFVGEINIKEFLRANLKVHQGEIIDLNTKKVIGKHDGIEFYTIGQREGLKIGGASEPYFVVGKDKSKNIVYVAQGSDNPALFARWVRFDNVHWIIKGFAEDKRISAAIRYRQEPAAGKLDLEQKQFVFDKPQRAIAPGQAIVFYQKDLCFGGAVIV